MSEARFLKATSTDDVIKFAKKHEVQFVDFKFTDLCGTWQHVTTTAREAYERCIPDGIPFDGSSIRGWKAINNSDMLAKIEPATAMLDPYNEIPTLSVVCSIFDPITKESYERDPRSIAQRATCATIRGEVVCREAPSEVFLSPSGSRHSTSFAASRCSASSS